MVWWRAAWDEVTKGHLKQLRGIILYTYSWMYIIPSHTSLQLKGIIDYTVTYHQFPRLLCCLLHLLILGGSAERNQKKGVNGKSLLRKIKWILQQCSNLTKATRSFQNSVILREVSIKAIFLRRWLNVAVLPVKYFMTSD